MINKIKKNDIILSILQYSTRGSDVQFTCHHGPNECYGNKVQSCAIDHIQVRIYFKCYNRNFYNHYNYIIIYFLTL